MKVVSNKDKKKMHDILRGSLMDTEDDEPKVSEDRLAQILDAVSQGKEVELSKEEERMFSLFVNE